MPTSMGTVRDTEVAIKSDATSDTGFTPDDHRGQQFRKRDPITTADAPGAQFSVADLSPDRGPGHPGDRGRLCNADQVAGDRGDNHLEELACHAASLSASGLDGRASAAADHRWSVVKKPVTFSTIWRAS